MEESSQLVKYQKSISGEKGKFNYLNLWKLVETKYIYVQ